MAGECYVVSSKNPEEMAEIIRRLLGLEDFPIEHRYSDNRETGEYWWIKVPEENEKRGANSINLYHDRFPTLSHHIGWELPSASLVSELSEKYGLELGKLDIDFIYGLATELNTEILLWDRKHPDEFIVVATKNPDYEEGKNLLILFNRREISAEVRKRLLERGY